MESPDLDWTPSPLQLAMAARSRSSAPIVLREDCWSEEATCTLLEEWGHRFLTANRKSLRQHLWQQVADAVNRRHGSSRTDLQCKNRVDTLKKRYKVEKARVLRSRNNTYLSPWPFFSALATLIGDHFPPKTSSCPSPPPSTASKTPSFTLVSVPVRPRSQKRFAMHHPPDPLLPHTAAAAAGKMFLRRHIRPVVSGSDSEVSRSLSDGKKRSGCGSERGYEKLANALKGLVEVYERVEMWKHRELVEMEKQRMQFLDELEKERIRWFQEMQAHLRNSKKPKLTSMAG